MADRQTGVARRVTWSVTLTAVSLAMFETLGQIGGWVPEPVGVLALIVAGCAFVGGSQGGLASALLCVGFAVFAGTFDSRMFPADDLRVPRALVAVYALPSLALLVGVLRVQAQNRLARYAAVRSEADVVEQHYRRLIERLGGVLWQVRLPHFHVESVSHDTRERFGYPVSEWLDSDRIWSVLVHPGDRERLLAAFRTAALDRLPQEISHRIVTRTGDTVEVRTLVQLQPGDSSEDGRLAGVTVLRSGDDAAAALPNLERAVLDQLDDPVLIMEPTGRLVDSNRAAREALGFGRRELLVLDATDLGIDAAAPEASPVRTTLNRMDGSDVLAEVRLQTLQRGERMLTVAHIRLLEPDNAPLASP